MHSASPTCAGIARQSSSISHEDAKTFAVGRFFGAKNAESSDTSGRYRGVYHPPATGDGHP